MKQAVKGLFRHAPALLLCLIVGAIAFAFFRLTYAGADAPAPLPELAGETAQIQQENYVVEKKEKADIHTGQLILVNNAIHYRFPDNEPLQSVFDFKTGSYKVSDKNVKLNPALAEPLNAMFDDFYRKTKYGDVMVISGYRTAEHQQNLLASRTQQTGAQAASWVAAPGGSEHHTGFALDLGLYTSAGQTYDYDGEGACRWLGQNAYRYGFIVRYPSEKAELTGINYEPWHFRYVGHPHAYLIAKNDMCLEEYIDYLRGFEFGKKHLTVSDLDGRDYEIYFVKATGASTDVPVPVSGNYTVSGNNVDGFIVTAQTH